MPETTPSSAVSVVQQIPVDQIRPSSHQARKNFDEDALNRLAQSIKLEGLLQAITVRKVGDSYEMVAGERRLRATKLLGWTTIEARIIQTVSEAESAAKGLVENLQRENLNPIEEAQGFQELHQLDPNYWTQNKIADLFGQKQSYISESLALLTLPDPIKDNICRQILPRSLGVELTRLGSPDAQLAAAKQIEGLNRQQARKILKVFKGGEHPSPQPPQPDVDGLGGPLNAVDPLAQSWDEAHKDGIVVRCGDWAAAYGQKGALKVAETGMAPYVEGWLFWISADTYNPQKVLAVWFGRLAELLGYKPGIMEAIEQEQLRAIPNFEEAPKAELPQEKVQPLKLRLPQTPEEQAELQAIAAKSKGPAPIYAWVLGPHHDMTESAKPIRWEHKGYKDGLTALPQVLAGLQKLAQDLAAPNKSEIS